MSVDPTKSSSILARMLDLRRVTPFNQLDENELALIADAGEPREIAPDQMAHPGGRSLGAVWVTVGGGLVLPDGTPAPPLVDLPALFGGTETGPLRSGPEGARLLLIRKGFFFAFLRECPAFAHGLIIAPGLEFPRPA